MKVDIRAVLAIVAMFLIISFATATFAATIYQTSSSDTISTFRTNVNSSLVNLNTGLTSAGPIATSSVPTVGRLAYWTGAGTPSTLGSVATGTISASGGITATASQYIIGSGLTIGCTAASSGVTGCLSGTDWTTFNGKENVLTFSAPLIRSTNTISWTGLATSSQPASSNILVSNGAAGVYGVATSTLSASSPLTGSFTQIGSSGSLGIQAASGSQNGYLSSSDYSLLHTATSTFTAPLAWTASTNAVTCTSATASITGCLTPTNFNLFNMKVATSAAETAGQIPYWTTTGGSPATLGSVATGTVTGTNGITVTASRAAIGGALAIDCTAGSASATGCLSAVNFNAFNMKVGTSSAETAGQLAAWGTTGASPAKLYSVATTAITCSGNIACTAFTGLGAASGISFTGTLATGSGGTGTTTWLTNSVPYFNGTRFVEANGALSFNGSILTLTSASTTNLTAGTSIQIPNSSSQAPTAVAYIAQDTTNNQIVFGKAGTTGVLDERRFLTLTYATTTAWTGTTTLPTIPVPAGMTFNTIQCQTNAGTLNVQAQYGSGGALTFPAMFNASTTMGTVTWSSSNTPPSAATTTVAFGTPASSPTQIGCTISATITAT